MDHDKRLPDPQQSGRIDGLLASVWATDPDACVLEELSRAQQIAGVDAFGVAIEKVRDLRFRQHAVNLARRRCGPERAEEEPGNPAPARRRCGPERAEEEPGNSTPARRRCGPERAEEEPGNPAPARRRCGPERAEEERSGP